MGSRWLVLAQSTPRIWLLGSKGQRDMLGVSPVMGDSIRTCRDDSLHACAIDEGPLNGLCAHIRPVNTLLAGIIVQHCDVVDVGHREGDDVIVVGSIQVHAPDLHLTCVQQELLKLCGAQASH